MQPDLSILQEVVRALVPDWQRPAGPSHLLMLATVAGYLVAGGASAEEALAAVRDGEVTGVFPLSVLEAQGIPWFVQGTCGGSDRVAMIWSPQVLHPAAALALIEAGALAPATPGGNSPPSDAWHWFRCRGVSEDPPSLLTGYLEIQRAPDKPPDQPPAG